MLYFYDVRLHFMMFYLPSPKSCILKCKVKIPVSKFPLCSSMKPNFISSTNVEEIEDFYK
jgi:hypothetical protein